MKRLFLDDLRMPVEAFEYMKYNVYLEDWVVVRNFGEFVEYITTHGLPDVISFDHDLAMEHYTPQTLWTDYHKSQDYQEMVGLNYKEKTGKDCADWLVSFCVVNQFRLPKYLVHSMNPVGRDNITYVLKHFEQNREKYLGNAG